MKIAILYYLPGRAYKKLSMREAQDYAPVIDGLNTLRVRSQVIVSGSLVSALDSARPREGETVLNSVRVN